MPKLKQYVIVAALFLLSCSNSTVSLDTLGKNPTPVNPPTDSIPPQAPGLEEIDLGLNLDTLDVVSYSFIGEAVIEIPDKVNFTDSSTIGHGTEVYLTFDAVTCLYIADGAISAEHMSFIECNNGQTPGSMVTVNTQVGILSEDLITLYLVELKAYKSPIATELPQAYASHRTY